MFLFLIIMCLFKGRRWTNTILLLYNSSCIYFQIKISFYLSPYLNLEVEWQNH